MRKLYLILLMCCIQQSLQAQCTDIFIALNSQEEIDNFATNYGCTTIEGDLFIDGTDISNLNGLSGLTSIGDDLVITDNNSLTNIDGLNNITFIGGNLSMSHNNNLPNTNGLSNLQTIGGNLNVGEDLTSYVFAGLETIEGDFPSLIGLATNPNALPSLTHIGGDLSFSYIGAQDVMALSSLESIGGSLTILEGFVLYSLDGFENLHTIGGSLIFDYTIDLQNINGLSGLTSIGGDLLISSFSGNTDYSGLNSVTTIGGSVFLNDEYNANSLNALTTIGGSFNVSNNYSIVSIDGFDSLTEIQGDLELYNNGNLENIEGLSSLTYIGGNISITENTELSNCCMALDWETLTTGNITIESNNVGCEDYDDVVSYCNGLNTYSCEGNVVLNSQEAIDNFATNYDCTVIQGNLLINNTDATNLDGLNAITSIEGALSINNNSTLANIDGLSNITSIGGTLEIENCPNLSNTNGLSNLQTIGGDLLVHATTYTFPALTSIGGDLVDPYFLLYNTDGLQNLTFLGGDLFIFGYGEYPELSSFSNLESIGGNLYLEELVFIESLEGFNNLATIGGNFTMWTVISDNWNGFSNLTEIGGELQIDYCNMTSLNIFNNITNIGGLAFSGLGHITSTEGFESLINIDDNLNINYCNALTTITGFNTLTNIGGDLKITGHGELLTISGFENLNTIGNELRITNNAKLTDCCILIDWAEITEGTIDISDNNGDCATLSQIIDLCEDDGTGTVCDGTIILTSQEEVDNFVVDYNCTNLNGNLFVQGNSISNLDGLNIIESIEGDLRIEDCINLTNIDGLSNLITVGGDLAITGNALDNTNGLSNLETVGGDFNIYSTNYTFPSLTSIGGNLNAEFLEGNENAVVNLTYVGGDVNVYFNGLTDLSCFSSLETIEGTLYFEDLFNLNSLDGLENLTTLGGLHMWWCYGLEDIDALSGITSLEFITIEGAGLTNLDGLSNITQVNGNVIIDDIASLTNIEGLYNITNIQGNLSISNTGIEAIYGFDNLVSIGGYLSLENNDMITSIYGFTNITSIGEGFNLNNNDDLLGFGGFNNLGIIGGDIFVENNTKLADCCVLKCLSEIDAEITINNNNEGCDTFQEVLDNCEDEYNDCTISNIATISVFAFADLNENGVYDINEYGLFNQEFSLQPNELVSYTNNDGLVNFIVGTGDYTLVWEDNPLWTLTTDNAISVSNTDDGTQFNFGLTPVTDYVQVFGDYTSAPTRCGFEVTSWISYENNGTEPTQGVVEYKMNELVSFVEAEPAPDYIDATTGTLQWNYNSLLPTYTEQIKLSLQMPGVDFLGSMIDSEGFIYSISEAGDTLSQSKFVHNSELTCAYDPNDKLVIPNGFGEDNYTLLEDSIYQYTVRFQNTGNDTAFNVRIEDYLDTDFDWSTFRVTSSSHEMNTTLEEETGLLTFYFNDIYLPDSNINEPASHGFVKYEIKSKADLEIATTLENTAYIYFDFNPAIVTNTTTNTLVEGFPILLASIDLKVYLEGAYNPETQTMNTTLQENNILPLTQPYGDAPYNYSGLENLQSATNIPTNVVDWVLVEARSGTPELLEANTTIIEKRAGLLLADGSIVGVNGSSLFFRSLEYGQAYHFVIRHRTHLDIISKTAIQAEEEMAYDFTTEVEKAFGIYQQINLQNNKAAMFTGDYTQDGIIQVTDYDLWKEAPAQNNAYESTDGLLDGVVQNTDLDAWRKNKAKIGVVEIRF